MFDFGTSLNTKTVFSRLIPLLHYGHRPRDRFGELLRMNNGELEIKSRPGQGTTVTFLFPATEKTNTAE